jgi:ribonuclease D
LRTEPDTPIVVREQAELERLAAESRADGRMGLDTEFIRERTYRPRLCLVQVATPVAVHVIDPLDGCDLSPVASLLADSSVEVVVHAGKQDLALFFDFYGVTPTRVFDVQIAAAFAGYGGGLSYGRVVNEVVGATLAKGEAYSDWCRRPLTGEQLRYAADDVRHLLEIADRLRARLRDAGRLSWVEEEMRALETADSYRVDAGEAWRRVPGRGGLSGGQTAVLREVARWREEAAARRDLPRGWVLKDPTMIEIARRAPETVAQLKSIRGVGRGQVDKSGRAILDAVARGKSGPPVPTPSAPPRSAQVRARLLSGLADAVVRARCERAGIATELVATRSDLESLMADYFAGGRVDSNHRLLKGWRRELAGDAVLALAEGKIAVRSVPEPPYVEEVPL